MIGGGDVECDVGVRVRGGGDERDLRVKGGWIVWIWMGNGDGVCVIGECGID